MGKRSRAKRERRAHGAADGVAARPPGAPDRPRGRVRPSRRSRWRALSLILVHVLIAVHLAHWMIAKTTLTPLEPSEIVQTFSQGLVNAGALLFVAAILSTAIFGRFFCGWGCHIIALQDLCAWLLGKFGIEPRHFRSRLLVFMPLLAAIVMFVVPSLARIWMGGAQPELQWHLATDDMWARFPSWPVALTTLFVCGFGIVYVLGNKAFCTYACPYGGIFGLVEPLAPLRIRVTDACDGCAHCTATCTSNVRVHEEVRVHAMVVDPGCMKCTDCVSVCPKDALYLGIGRPALGRPAPRAEPHPLGPAYSWPEELGLAAAFIVSTLILRKLYDGIPFLLSLALAAISAHAILTAWRMATRADDTSYLRTVLKRGGRITSRGRWFGWAVVLWLAFLAHSSLIQYWSLSGSAEARSALGALQANDVKAGDRPALQRDLEKALDKLAGAERYGLVSVGNQLGLLGAGHAELGRHDLAERLFRRAIHVSPRYAYAQVWLADYAERRGDREAQLRFLRAALLADPEWPDAHEKLIRTLSEGGEIGVAQRELEQLLEERPSSARLRLSYGMLLANRGDLEGGITETRRVIDSSPDNATARFNLILLLANRGRFAEAREACEQLLPLRPDSADIQRTCARIDAAAAAE